MRAPERPLGVTQSGRSLSAEEQWQGPACTTKAAAEATAGLQAKMSASSNVLGLRQRLLSGFRSLLRLEQ